MSYANSSAAPAGRQRSPLVYVGVGCAIVAVCGLCAGIAFASWYFFSQRTAPAASRPAVEYILDASPRMAQPSEGEGGTRMAVAQGVLAEIIRPSDPTVTAGLRVFGTGAVAVGCQDTDLLVPLALANQGQISTHVLSLSAGSNPAAAMGQAMITAIRDLAATKGAPGAHTLVVVTGGSDSCNPQAGQLIAAEAKKAGIQLQLFVVGYQVSADDGTAIKGLVDGAGGNYVNAKNKSELTTILNSIQLYVNNSSANSLASVLATSAAAGGGGAATPAVATLVATVVPTTNGAATPEATAAATAVPPTSGVSASGPTACDHAYFPLRPGSTWTFTTGSGNMTWTVTGVTGDMNDATATMDFSLPPLLATYHWHCTPGGIESYDFGNFALGGATGLSKLKVTKNTGYWLIAADQLLVGASWDNSYTIQYDLSAGGTSVTFTDAVSRHSSVAATEPQTVSGASHAALRVESSEISTLSFGSSGGTTTNTATKIWLVRGIGPVRFDGTSEGKTTTSVLTSYSIP